MELEMLISGLRQDNTKLRELLNEKDAEVFQLKEELKKVKELKDLKKRVADLEEQLTKKVFLLDDEGTPIKSFTLTGKLTLMDEPEPTEEKLEVGKWYDARTFEVEKLKELLPVGTKVAIIHNSHIDKLVEIKEKEANKNTHVSEVSKITEEYDLERGKKQTVVYVNLYEFISNNWFKIIKEN